jgi:hypothetical protein
MEGLWGSVALRLGSDNRVMRITEIRVPPGWPCGQNGEGLFLEW